MDASLERRRQLIVPIQRLLGERAHGLHLLRIAFHAYADGWWIQFDSAWAPPWPVIRRLSEKFLTLAVTHHWAGEHMGFDCGRMVLKGGAILD